MAISPHGTPAHRRRRVNDSPRTPVRPRRHIETPPRPVRPQNHGSGILDVVRVRLGRRIQLHQMHFGSPQARPDNLVPVLRARKNNPRGCSRISDESCPAAKGPLVFTDC